MKTKTNKSGLLFFLAITGFIFLSGSSYAQQKTEDQAKSKKTITIHVTKEIDGNTVVLDTIIITDGDFDADAFLEEKGVMDNMPEAGRRMKRDIVIRHPGSHEYNRYENDNEGNMPDTMRIEDNREIAFNDNFDMPDFSHDFYGMPFNDNYTLPEIFSNMQAPQLEAMIERLARSYGLDNMLPFGDLKQVVVKKRHHGKKVIITFEDRDGENDNQRHEYRNEDRIMNNRNTNNNREERVIIRGNSGERDGTNDNSPVEKKVIIIKKK